MVREIVFGEETPKMTRKMAPIVAVTTLILSAHAGASQSVLKQTQALVKALEAVETPPKGQSFSKAAIKANQSAFSRLDRFFDFNTLTSKAIEPHLDHLNKEQTKRFKAVFKKLIRLSSYARSGSFLDGADYTLKRTDDPMSIALDAYVPAEDYETTVVFHWAKRGDDLKLIDTSFDGSSLVRNYQNQFGRIIKKEGVEGLLTKLQDRLDKVQSS